MRTYLRHRIWNVLDIRNLIALEYLNFEGKYKNYSESHDFWELCFVLDGNISITVDEESKSLSEGELVLIEPNKTHSYFSATGNGSRVFVICFESYSSALKPLGGLIFSKDRFITESMTEVIYESENTFRINSEEHLETLEKPNFGGQQVIVILLEHLLIKLLREVSSWKNSDVIFLKNEDFYSDLSKAVIKFFEEHIRENLSLNDVCKKMNYSRSFLCKTFKEQTGETIMACFNRMKVEEAGRLLTDTNMKVSDVAAYMGFGETKHFAELFGKYMGTSPTKYRRRDE